MQKLCKEGLYVQYRFDWVYYRAKLFKQVGVDLLVGNLIEANGLYAFGHSFVMLKSISCAINV